MVCSHKKKQLLVNLKLINLEQNMELKLGLTKTDHEEAACWTIYTARELR